MFHSKIYSIYSSREIPHNAYHYWILCQTHTLIWAQHPVQINNWLISIGHQVVIRYLMLCSVGQNHEKCLSPCCSTSSNQREVHIHLIWLELCFSFQPRLCDDILTLLYVVIRWEICLKTESMDFRCMLNQRDGESSVRVWTLTQISCTLEAYQINVIRYTACTIMQVSILTTLSFLCIFFDFNLYKHEWMLDLTLWDVVDLGIEKNVWPKCSTAYIQVCIIIRQLLHLHKMKNLSSDIYWPGFDISTY